MTADDIFGGIAENSGDAFMEESIVQDSPFWEMFASIKDAVTGKVSDILGVLGRVAIGATPVIGDVIDAYELISGKDFFTGEKLTYFERALSAFGLLVGSAATWRAIAKGLDNELAGFVGRIPAKNITEARSMLKNAMKDVEVCGDWKRMYSKSVNKGRELDKLPYRNGMSAFEGVTKNNEVFYRVFSDNNIQSSWLIKFDPAGMSPKELQNILALPKIPTHIAKVRVPAGTKIRVGNAGENMWGKGGVTQWEIIKTKSQSYKDLNIIFENIGKL